VALVAGTVGCWYGNADSLPQGFRRPVEPGRSHSLAVGSGHPGNTLDEFGDVPFVLQIPIQFEALFEE
jgi:hypothetical protein